MAKVNNIVSKTCLTMVVELQHCGKLFLADSLHEQLLTVHINRMFTDISRNTTDEKLISRSLVKYEQQSLFSALLADG